jgi:hypothetical protein
MDTPTLLGLPPEVLRTQVTATVRKHWVVPRRVDRPEPVPPARIEAVARAALDVMLTRPFRIGPLPPPEVYERLLERVRLRVRRNQRIRVALGYGPLKNQNAVPYSRADWAEFFALCHLAAWHNKVQPVYAPGLEIRIVFDDATLAMANHVAWPLMHSYMASVKQLIQVLGYGGLFMPTFRQSTLAWFLHLGFYQIARWRVRRWERDPANQAQLERMNEFARRNLALHPGLSPDEQERHIRAASHRYRVYWEALQLSGLTRSKRRVVAMYLDGSQHHLRQPIALHLTTLDKGQVTQPWQGEGALLDNGHGKLEPFVLTAGRRLRYTTQTVEGLDLVPCAGFERLAVAWPNVPA